MNCETYTSLSSKYNVHQPVCLISNPAHCRIKHNCSLADSDSNIQLNVPSLLLNICRQFDERNTHHLLPNAAYTIGFTLYQLWSPANPTQLQFCTFRLQYSIGRVSDAIVDTSTIRCALYSTPAAKCSPHHSVCAI
jgi:hypothetical protein